MIPVPQPAPAAGPPPRGARAGFTAVELMVGIAFFGILVLGFLSVFPLGLRTVEKSERMTVASSLAQSEMERLKALPFTDADLAAGAHADPGNPLQAVFTRNWTVTDDSPMAGMKRVDVAVAYTDNGIPRTIRISTYLSP